MLYSALFPREMKISAIQSLFLIRISEFVANFQVTPFQKMS